MKYIPAEKLVSKIKRLRSGIESNREHYNSIPLESRNELDAYYAQELILNSLMDTIDSLQQEQDMGEVSDGYHTFNELYYYRMLYNAAFFNLLPKNMVHKSKRHHTGEECFGGRWFIVIANLPTGQISNHYELKDWDLFKVPEKEIADEWDGHTPQEAADRLRNYLQQEQPGVDEDFFFNEVLKVYDDNDKYPPRSEEELTMLEIIARHFYELGINARKEE